MLNTECENKLKYVSFFSQNKSQKFEAKSSTIQLSAPIFPR